MRKILVIALLGWASQVQSFPWFIHGDNIRGAQLMTPEERKAYVARLWAVRSFDECRATMQAHYLELDRRAKEGHVVLPPIQGDPCEIMRGLGRFR
ncbi:MAG TPA: hypothetical protein PKH69_05195 [Thiobacillaceae bacterium]|nr:hypothetical protein [Thiobacillaceae bacterium]HNU64101.1 hypothetical protein [Thiobacillaceae bacterium]